LSIVYFGLFAQNDKADKRIAEIESFKKYEITKIDTSALKVFIDSTTEVTGIVYYIKKSKNNLFGKITVNTKTDFGEVKRDLYLYENAGLFAIIDNIKRNDNTIEKLTYYIEEGQPFEVIDQNGKNVTEAINRKQFEYSIKLMFTRLLQQQFKI